MKEYDVIILGGGTAGAMAAVAAARSGARTLIIEQYGHLGGTAVYGIPFLGILSGDGTQVNRGLVTELLERLCREKFCFGIADGGYWNTPENPDSYGFNLTPFDPEGLKYVLQEMVLEAGAEILFHTMLSSVAVRDGRVRAIEVCYGSGREWISAEQFLDCSGDAVLVWQAGGRFIRKAHLQNSSILFHLGNVDLKEFQDAQDRGDRVLGKGSWHTRIVKGSKTPGAEPTLVHLAGHLQPFEDDREVTFTAVSYRDGEVYLNATRIAGIDGSDVFQASRGEIEERRHVIELYRAMKERVPGFSRATLLNTSPLGVRESRNILGKYVIQREDVLEGRSFTDGVARGAYPIDIHDPKGGRTQFQFIRNGGSYEIPLRAMIPEGLDGVMVAGRCISAEHNAVGSVRIMGCVMSQGEAAGTAAAQCVRDHCEPRELDGAALKRQLLGSEN